MKKPIYLSLCLSLLLTSAMSYAEPSKKEALEAIKKSAAFMANEVSNRGGYVYVYTEDLSDQWGEIPARKTQIWTQPPGTPTVGQIFLKAYHVTGEPEFLKYAENAADALIWGQHPTGGWHYLIDFDMPGLKKWYEDIASRCWGWEEYYHYYGNCSFDDDATSGPTEFLLELYMTTLDPKYRVPLIKALDFILEAQYPNGGWPQRYPLSYEYPHDGHEDYTHFYTFNDGIIVNNIHLLLKAYEQLGVEKYREAAVRGMDFVIISQLPPPQAGWGQQYDMNMQTAPARSYEPASVMPQYTVWNVSELMKFYTITGDRRYLHGIPDALEWLDNSYLPEGHAPNDQYTHAMFVELGTNKPIYPHVSGSGIEDGKTWISYDPKNTMPGYGMWYRIDMNVLRNEYERVSALTPDQARAEYEAERKKKTPAQPVGPAKIEEIIQSLDERGAWVEDITMRDYFNPWFGELTTFRGINIRTFINNMNALTDYLQK
ncbi:MAG: pectate lyase [Candidatus Latescibacteria bacterium]|nr:pectate lyase [Candidatus Latescibacterota bacterium]